MLVTTPNFILWIVICYLHRLGSSDADDTILCSILHGQNA